MRQTITETGGMAGWNSSGGNPGGYPPALIVSATSKQISAPSKFLGNWTIYAGGNLSYDHFVGRQTNIIGTVSHRVDISGPGGAAFWIGPGAAPPDSGWGSYSARLLESEWNITNGTWNTLLSDITSFVLRDQLYGNSGNGIDIEGIDNV